MKPSDIFIFYLPFFLLEDQSVSVAYPVKYADDLVPLGKEGMVLKGVTDRQIEIGRRCGMEMNVEKTKVLGFYGRPSPEQIMIH